MNFLLKISNSLSEKQKSRISKTIRFLTPFSKNLKLLAIKYGTDKWSHGYLKHYDRYFRSLRRKKLNILEIGIEYGASIQMWRDYFSRSQIYGIDKVEKSQYQSKRVMTFQGNQKDTNFLNQVVKKTGKLDIIIDDGSHFSEHVIISFCHLFPHLADNGIYVIEDAMTSYWPSYGGNWKDLQSFPSTIRYLKNLVDGLNHAYIPHYKSNYFHNNIVSIHFYPKIVFIFKGKNCPILTQQELRQLQHAKNHN